MAFKEKRREERYHVDMMCIVEKEHEFEVLDVSQHGISILGGKEYNMESSIDVGVEYGNGELIMVRGIIRNAVLLNGKHRYGLEITSHDDTWLHLVYAHMMDNK